MTNSSAFKLKFPGAVTFKNNRPLFSRNHVGYVSLPSSVFDQSPTAVSIEIRVNTNLDDGRYPITTGTPPLLSFDETAPASGFAFPCRVWLDRGANDGLSLSYSDPADGTIYSTVAQDYPFSYGEMQLVVTLEQGRFAMLYVNGVLAATLPTHVISHIPAAAPYATLGGDERGAFSGSISDVSVWAGAMSADEVFSRYTSEVAGGLLNLTTTPTAEPTTAELRIPANPMEPSFSASFPPTSSGTDVAVGFQSSSDKTIPETVLLVVFGVAVLLILFALIVKKIPSGKIVCPIRWRLIPPWPHGEQRGTIPGDIESTGPAPGTQGTNAADADADADADAGVVDTGGLDGIADEEADEASMPGLVPVVRAELHLTVLGPAGSGQRQLIAANLSASSAFPAAFLPFPVAQARRLPDNRSGSRSPSVLVPTLTTPSDLHPLGPQAAVSDFSPRGARQAGADAEPEPRPPAAGSSNVGDEILAVVSADNSDPTAGHDWVYADAVPCTDWSSLSSDAVIATIGFDLPQHTGHMAHGRASPDYTEAFFYSAFAGASADLSDPSQVDRAYAGSGSASSRRRRSRVGRDISDASLAGAGDECRFQ